MDSTSRVERLAVAMGLLRTNFTSRRAAWFSGTVMGLKRGKISRVPGDSRPRIYKDRMADWASFIPATGL